LSLIVFEYMKSLNKIESNKSFNGKTNHLYGIGSIINGGYQDAVVWGSGLISNRIFWWRKGRSLDIKCCRGPLTREILLKNGYSCPEIYGDPALLMPYIYEPQNISKKYETVLVRHCSVNMNEDNVDIVKKLNIVTNDYAYFIDTLYQAKKVVSSSLHGIILAEVYGIPAVFLHENNLDLTKYKDYYYSTGREKFPIAKSIKEALELEPLPIPDFKEIQKKLVETFPSDLFAR